MCATTPPQSEKREAGKKKEASENHALVHKNETKMDQNETNMDQDETKKRKRHCATDQRQQQNDLSSEQMMDITKMFETLKKTNKGQNESIETLMESIETLKKTNKGQNESIETLKKTIEGQNESIETLIESIEGQNESIAKLDWRLDGVAQLVQPSTKKCIFESWIYEFVGFELKSLKLQKLEDLNAVEKAHRETIIKYGLAQMCAAVLCRLLQCDQKKISWNAGKKDMLDTKNNRIQLVLAGLRGLLGYLELVETDVILEFEDNSAARNTILHDGEFTAVFQTPEKGSVIQGAWDATKKEIKHHKENISEALGRQNNGHESLKDLVKNVAKKLISKTGKQNLSRRVLQDITSDLQKACK